MFKIGEFSKLTQVSIRMLRYYDETGLLKPAQIDRWTGYRMYSVEQIPILNKIIYLRDIGFQVSEIAAALEVQEDSLFFELLSRKYLEIEKTILAEKEKKRKIEAVQKEILTGNDGMCCNVSLKSIPGCPVLSLRKVVTNYYAEGDLWQELSHFTGQQQIEISSDTFSIYHDTEYKETNVDIELCAPVKKLRKSEGNFNFRMTEPVPNMACTMVYGDFSNIKGAYLNFAKWLQENSQYRMSEPNRQIVHRGPWNESNPEKYLTELQIPLEMDAL